MTEQVKPARKRIVPQQILSPTKSLSQSQTEAERSVGPCADLGDLKQHSELAARLLGPGRKIYVDLRAYQAEQKPVDWKELLKEHGVKADVKAARAGTPQAEDVGGCGHRAVPEAMNPLASVIQKLERSLGMTNIPGDADDTEEESREDAGEAAVSGSEGEGEEERTEREDGEVGRAGGKEVRRRAKGEDYDHHDDWIDDSEFIDMIERADRRKPKFEGFFMARGAIDRSEEALPLPGGPAEGGGKAAARKRKAGAEGSGALQESSSDFEKPKRAKVGNGGQLKEMREKAKHKAVAEGVPVKKKKTKVEAAATGPSAALPPPGKGLSLAQMAAMAGAGAAGAAAAAGASPPPSIPRTAPPPSAAAPPSAIAAGATPAAAAAQQGPYEMPAEVAAAIAELRELTAREQPPPAAAAAEGDRGPRKSLPPSVRDRLKAVEATFQAQSGVHKKASRRIIDDLMSFMEPYTSRENLRLYVVGRPLGKRARGANSEAALISELRDLLARTVQPAPPPPYLGSDDDFVVPPAAAQAVPGGAAAGGQQQQQQQQPANGGKPPSADKWRAVPQAGRAAVYSHMTGRLQGQDLKSAQGKHVLQEVLNLFPPGTMDIGSLKVLYQKGRGKERRAEGAGPRQETPATASRAAAPAVPRLTPEHVQEAAAAAAMSVVAPPSAAVPPAAAAATFTALAPTAPVPWPALPAALATVAPPPLAAAAPAATPLPPSAAPQPLPPAPSASGHPPPPPAQQLPLRPRFSDEEAAAAGVGHGAAAAELRALLAACSALSAGTYLPVLTRTLMTAGPSGLTVSEVAKLAVEHGYATWDPLSQSVKSGLSRSTQKHSVAFLGGHKYALRCFPGIKEQPRAKSGDKAANGNGKGGTADGHADGSAMVPAQPAAPHQAAPSLPSQPIPAPVAAVADPSAPLPAEPQSDAKWGSAE